MNPEQPVIDVDAPGPGSTVSDPRVDELDLALAPSTSERAHTGERAARESLRAQIARLERELSGIVAQAFPHLPAWAPAPEPSGGPCLPTLAELELTRDQLAGRLQQQHRRVAARSERERRARERLERMKLEPGRYKFVRLPVSDLGEGGCGVYEVRPRFGIIGMLAGWWQLTLSSGCPLEMGSRPRRGPSPAS